MANYSGLPPTNLNFHYLIQGESGPAWLLTVDGVKGVKVRLLSYMFCLFFV